ncbi:MAG: hypothetical protein R6V40_00970, partial [Candidatus Moraniibacteriota bacterium]
AAVRGHNFPKNNISNQGGKVMKLFLKRIAIFCLLVVVSGFSLAEAGSSTSVSEQHFDKTMDEVKMQLGSIQGDTQNIVDVLGVVVEGSLPEGEGLISYCNAQGWNPWVIAGYNDLCPEQLDELPAGTKLEHPQTPKEMQEALKRGRQIRKQYYASRKQKLNVDEVTADTVSANRLKTKLAQVDKLEAQVANVEESNVELQRVNTQLVNELHAKKAEIEHLETKMLKADKAEIEHLEAELVTTKKLVADLVEAKEILTEELYARKAYIGQLEQKLAKKPKTITKTKTVYKTVEGEKVCSSSCDEKPFRVSGFWSTLSNGEYVEFKYRPDKTQQFKAVRVLKEGNWVRPSCERFWARDKISGPDASSLLKKGESLEPARAWELPEGEGGPHRTYMVLEVTSQ